MRLIMCDGGFKFNRDEREKMRELRVKHHVALHVHMREKKNVSSSGTQSHPLLQCCITS